MNAGNSGLQDNKLKIYLGLHAHSETVISLLETAFKTSRFIVTGYRRVAVNERENELDTVI